MRVLHRSRELLVRQRTMRVNAIRGHMAEFGIGPITASALAASVPDPTIFKSGRALAAWIG
jgi:transposase